MKLKAFMPLCQRPEKTDVHEKKSFFVIFL
jgi:hypothetical protein